MIDDGLTWDEQINSVTARARRVCGWMLSVFYSRDKHVMITLFNSLVRTKLEYCDIIWSPYKTKDINKIEGIQRYFTCKINGMKEYNYWDRLKKLDIMSLQRRRERNKIIYLWKIKNGVNPNSVSITFKENKRLNSEKAVLGSLPKTRGRLLTIHDESFLINAAKLWNTLPGELTYVKSLTVFKSGLDKFLKKIPDEPPLSGYPSRSNNSIIKQCLGLR